MYNTNYSKTTDTLKPQFEIKGKSVYGTIHNTTEGSKSMPWLEVRGNKMYNTAFHPAGRSIQPQYEIRGKSVYTTEYHPEGRSSLPVFNIKK